MEPDNTFLRRYTNLPSLIYLLSQKKITLLDPESWDDTNDSYFLSVYKKKKNLKTVLALCFAETAETYHHWKVFADGPSGACINFYKDKLLSKLPNTQGIRTGKVEYPEVKALEAWANGGTLSKEDLPFIKRYSYRGEEEFRVIFESDELEVLNHDIDIDISCIKSVSLSPWVHKSLRAKTKELIKKIDGCSGIKVVEATITDHDNWKSFADKAN